MSSREVKNFGFISKPPGGHRISENVDVIRVSIGYHLKNKVYTTRPTTIAALKTRIRKEITGRAMEVF